MVVLDGAEGKAYGLAPPDWHSIAFSPEGRHVIIAGGQTARIRDVLTQDSTAVLKPGCPMVETASFSPDGRSIATACADGAVMLWKAPAGGESDWKGVRLSSHQGKVTSAVFSNDSKLLRTVGQDGAVRLLKAG